VLRVEAFERRDGHCCFHHRGKRRGPSPCEIGRLPALEPGVCDGGDVAMIGAAAAADDHRRREQLPEFAVPVGELAGIPLVELLGRVQLGMALLRRVRADAAVRRRSPQLPPARSKVRQRS
jgi:hypothetical protein